MSTGEFGTVQLSFNGYGQIRGGSCTNRDLASLYTCSGDRGFFLYTSPFRGVVLGVAVLGGHVLSACNRSRCLSDELPVSSCRPSCLGSSLDSMLPFP